MAFPATCTLTGTFYDSSGGTGVRGELTITPTSELLNASGSVIVGPVPLVVPIAGGTFSVHLLPTDTAGVLPAGWSYAVVEQLLLSPSSPVMTRSVYWVKPTGTGTVDLSSLTHYTTQP
jgi:hypothetical protein